MNAIKEIWQLINEDNSKTHTANYEEFDSRDDLMALLVQALHGTEGYQTIRFRGFLAQQKVFMLLDTGNSHCFISQHIAKKLPGTTWLSTSGFPSLCQSGQWQ